MIQAIYRLKKLVLYFLNFWFCLFTGHILKGGDECKTGWWFQIIFIFAPTWGDDTI